jgi:hypothetical protein
MTEVTSAKNKIGISSNITLSLVNEILDQAECDNRSVSPFTVFRVREEGWGGEAMLEELDLTTTARPVTRTTHPRNISHIYDWLESGHKHTLY